MKLFTSLVMILIFTVILGVVTSHAEIALEPFTYSENFETNELSAWASYPLWQDTAYDPNMHVHTMVPGDPNLSIVQRVTPYTKVDNYGGAQKLLDMYLVPGSTIKLRYYIKTNLPAEYVQIRLAVGPLGAVDYTVPSPVTNRWQWVTASWDDFLSQNLNIGKTDKIKVNAVAVLAKIPDADPDMPFYFGVDDVTVKGARAAQFQFTEPEMYKLSEWKPYIPAKHYQKGDAFGVRGTWPCKAERTELTVAPFTQRNKTVYSAAMKKSGEAWLAQFKLTYPEGLYLVTLKAMKGKEVITDTEFTFYVAPSGIGGRHPRLLFDGARQKWVSERMKSDRFKLVAEEILNKAKEVREKNPIDSVVYDFDQMHTVMIKNVPLTIYPWFDRISPWRDCIYYNSFAYGLLGDKEAGEYTKKFIVKLSSFPRWVHPWWLERGQHIYYPVGELGMDVAIGYDLVYDLLDENERKLVRSALRSNVVIGCHKGYVEDNIVTTSTSNWVAHITGGSILSQAVMYGDGSEALPVEPYFTGVMFKTYDLVQKAFCADGAYGEGYGYYGFTMLSLSKSLPSADNVFKINLSEPIKGTYKELIWAGIVKDKRNFYFGDSSGDLGNLYNWAWLLDKYKDPLIGWFYNHLKSRDSLGDVLYETRDVPSKDPFDEDSVRFFPVVGTTVFKSGWEKDDFVFVMRTGAFYNHQHIDQGSFWLSDKGSLFIEERHGSTYYDDPLYQPLYTQPIAHSTILINHSHQSQRAGDPLKFAEGFDDRAFIYHCLDGGHAAFTSGDIGRLYWGKVKDLKRNVLFLKPRTLLMLDTIVPSEPDVDVTLLYQTKYLKDIRAGDKVSTITVDNNSLAFMHLYSEHPNVESVETPHYLSTLTGFKPLEKEGMLTVTAKTSGIPLVIANLLTTSGDGKPNVSIEKKDGFISGVSDGVPFAFSTRPGDRYEAGGFKTDAAALSWKDSGVFAALCTTLEKGGKMLVQSKEAITCEVTGTSVKYYLASESEVFIGVETKPSQVSVNGSILKQVTYDPDRQGIVVKLPSGEGIVAVQQ